MKQKLPIGIQSFREIRTKDYLYIDKTAAIYRLITSGKYYFLSRPRRFGKSLTLSTIKSIFQGDRALFKDLWIENKWNWEQICPTIHIGFSSIGYKTAGLEVAISRRLDEIAKSYGILLSSKEYDQKFKELIRILSEKNNVVLLIDEYDKPIIDYLDDIAQAKKNQKILKSFYSIIKDMDNELQLLFITGVSKFSKVSIFSELNNLDDITIDRRFADLVGITQSELEYYFQHHLKDSQEILEVDRKELLKQVKEWYNGYSWDGKTYVYNPFSVLGFFAKSDFMNFWFATGTPTFLINLLRQRQLIDLGPVEVNSIAFESYNIDNIDTFPLLFQTGYLTIKAKEDFGIYVLDYPNKEVKEAMLSHLIGSFRNDSPARTTPLVVKLRKAFLENDINRIITIINSLYKSIPSHIFIKEKEAYYHSIVFLVFKYLGQFIDAEVHTSDGRIDAVVQTDTHIYLLEFKLDESAKKAIAQIESKDYPAKFQSLDKKIIGLGINFDSTSKSIGDWQMKEF